MKFGGWVSIGGLVAPLLLTLDRLAIGATLGARAVAAYSIPNGLVSRLSLVPASLASAMFPRLAYSDGEERHRLLSMSIAAIAVTTTPLVIALVLIIDPFLRVLVGPDLAAASIPVAYVLVGGAWVSSYSSLPFSVLQAAGRPDLITKLRMAQVLPYCLALFAGIWQFGLVGAAAAYALRTSLDCALLFRLVRTPLSSVKPLLFPAILLAASIGIAAYATGLWRYSALGLLLVAALAWSFLNMPPPVRSIWDRMTGFLLSRWWLRGGSR
jgi:O-antigen/teichoic acid export membrane protein